MKLNLLLFANLARAIDEAGFELLPELSSEEGTVLSLEAGWGEWRLSIRTDLDHGRVMLWTAPDDAIFYDLGVTFHPDGVKRSSAEQAEWMTAPLLPLIRACSPWGSRDLF